ncbi:hypothetical protein SAY87_010750 [Trapa incisa]|uniref:Uncharacterized protein n=1 Tax=Trapa incisa TaxID=236973 RepID=A0AAN7GPY7_9MYRT|nr:hypothetical protein SAY87_010750 [Trapa incisa]
MSPCDPSLDSCACLSSTQIFWDADIAYLSSGKIQQEFCRVHGDLRSEPHGREVLEGIFSPPMVNRVAFRKQQKLVKHVKHSTGRLVYRCDYCPSRLNENEHIILLKPSSCKYFLKGAIYLGKFLKYLQDSVGRSRIKARSWLV